MTIEADNFRICVKKLEIRLKLADEQIKLKDSLLEQYRDAFQNAPAGKVSLSRKKEPGITRSRSGYDPRHHHEPR